MNTSASHCRARDGGDALDLELASRLNSRLSATNSNADHMQPMRPVFKELLYWAIATIGLTAVAIVWAV